MKVCGFSFVRNGVTYDYPFKEAYQSILPICDSMVVAVGQSTDNTLEVVKSIDPKIKVIETTWDDTKRDGGRVLAIETDKAFQAIPAEFDWAFYIQGDEVVHESYLPVIKEAMEKYLNDTRVDGLLFNYIHFFGSYDYVGVKYSWYRREVRVIKNNKDIFSWRDAQGFRIRPKRKLRVKLINASIHHYGWVRNPKALQQKINANIFLYKDNAKEQQEELNDLTFNYDKQHEPVVLFKGSHPNVMKDRINEQNWNYRPDTSLIYSSLKDKFKRLTFKYTGWIPGEYRNYIRI